MRIRKLPFGYQVVMGKIVRHPQEAKLVEHIFHQYTTRATYNSLVAELREQPVPYDAGKVWNKNMVARILEDRRYTGESGFPPVIDAEILERAHQKRSVWQTAPQKTESQTILRQLSGHTATKEMERGVLHLLNSLIRNPQRIRMPETVQPIGANIQELQRKLTAIMDCQPVDEDAAKKLILAIAAAQYDAIGPCKYETMRLRRLFAQWQPMTKLDAALLRSSVSAIRCYRDGSLEIRLKNDQIIGKSELV